MDHLSSVDASFLHLETPETPMHVGSLMLFELPKGYTGDYYEDVKDLLAKRMHLCSIFHRKLAQMPFELKKAAATHIVNNNGSLDDTRRQVVEIYSQLKQSV